MPGPFARGKVLALYPVFHGLSVITQLIEPAVSYAKIDLTRETAFQRPDSTRGRR
jgi:hypothetical protein